MATVTIRLDDRTREELEGLAQTTGGSISEILRKQIDALLGRDVRMDREDVPHMLSMQQRLVLAQQHEILTLLHGDDEDEAEHHRNMAEVLRRGFAGEYDALFAGIYPEISRTECSLLWDILDMFSMLEASVLRLSESDRQSLGEEFQRRLQFNGFDLNDVLESRLLSYLRYLLRTERWSQLQKQFDAVGDNGNSHHRNLPTYRRMLEQYQSLVEAKQSRGRYNTDAWLLDAAQLKQVGESWVHPSNRRSAAALRNQATN